MEKFNSTEEEKLDEYGIPVDLSRENGSLQEYLAKLKEDNPPKFFQVTEKLAEKELNEQMDKAIVPEMTLEELKRRITRYYPEYISILENIEVANDGSFIKDDKPIDYKGIVDYINYSKNLGKLDEEIKKGKLYNRGY